MMNKQPTQDTIQTFTVLLEFLPEKLEESDPAFIYVIGRDTVEALQDDGITVQPVYTGQQGGDFIVEILPTVSQLATTAWNTVKKPGLLMLIMNLWPLLKVTKTVQMKMGRTSQLYE